MRQIKNSEEEMSEMCKEVEKYAVETAIKLLISLVKKGRLTVEEAAEESGLSLADFTKRLSVT